ncbi:hypothetical protein JKF63_03575 [Porcisia hertigi]|uniref:Uncharacterized protein n=1 Tax=Porcisia hertigi TaxID=2761500 RepID=A0A836L865_9TRYP|nr:hypothetical protein JKF63_03575 [Porcisia hertigi]
MANSDVDVILHNYFATIAEKDSDALKLFEDNKRMRCLVEQALKAREELEAQLRTTQLLVASLQTDLREKHHLIEAQDKESAVWREGIAELRSVLDRPSELDHGLGDVVNDVRNILAELCSLRQNMQNSKWCCDEWEAYVLALLVASEARERHVLERAAIHSLQGLSEAMVEVRNVRIWATAHQAATEAIVADWESWQKTVQQDRECAKEKHAQALQRVSLMARRQANLAISAQQNAKEMEQRLMGQQYEEHFARERSALEAEAQLDLMNLLIHRCAAAEKKWCTAVLDARTVTHQLEESVKKFSDLFQAHEEALVEQHQNRLRVSKLTKNLERLKEQQSELEELQQRCSMQQEELQALRHKYVSIADKERNLRYQLNTATETAAAKLLSSEESLQSAERRAVVLEERLNAAREEARAAQKEVSVLKQQVEQHHTTDAVLQATQQQLRETEKHAFNFQEALEMLKADHRAQLQTERDRHEAEMAELADANEETLQRQAAQASARVEEAEERAARARETAAREKEELRRELEAWSAEVDVLKSELAKSRQGAEAEKAARKVLEQQSRSEASVVRSMVERSLDDAQRGPQLVELQKSLSIVQQRNGVLEEACRRSASVIAQLREALHKERMTSRSLRLKDDILVV